MFKHSTVIFLLLRLFVHGRIRHTPNRHSLAVGFLANSSSLSKSSAFSDDALTKAVVAKQKLLAKAMVAVAEHKLFNK